MFRDWITSLKKLDVKMLAVFMCIHIQYSSIKSSLDAVAITSIRKFFRKMRDYNYSSLLTRTKFRTGGRGCHQNLQVTPASNSARCTADPSPIMPEHNLVTGTNCYIIHTMCPVKRSTHIVSCVHAVVYLCMLSANATTSRPFTITEFAASTPHCLPMSYQALMAIND